MPNIITIDTEYYMTATATVDLSPKTWDDVDDWYVKWDVLQVKFKGVDDWESFTLESDTEDGVDWSRPNKADIFEGQYDYDHLLATRENF
jgi:hypothetical protein